MKAKVATFEELRDVLNSGSSIEKIVYDPTIKYKSFTELPSWKEYITREFGSEKAYRDYQKEWLNSLPKVGDEWFSRGRKHKMVTIRQAKKILNKDSSAKFLDGWGGGVLSNNIIYEPYHGHKQVTDYYLSLENRIRNIRDDKELIKDFILVRNKRKKAKYYRNGKMLTRDGIIYDGGEFAIQEADKLAEKREKMYKKQNRNSRIREYNALTKKITEEVLKSMNVRITKEAKEKAHKISEEMIKVSEGNNEIYMGGSNFISKINDPVIRDIYIPKQETSPSSCSSLEEGGTMKSLFDEGKYSLAWIHSHANMSVSHSSTDDRHLKQEVFRVGKRPQTSRGIKIDLSIPSISLKNKLRFYPSLVFNAKREEPHVEIGAGYWFLQTPDKNSESKKVRKKVNCFSKKNALLKVINENNGIDLNISTIDKEIREKVDWPSKNSNLEETLDQQPISSINLSSTKKKKESAPFFEKAKTKESKDSLRDIILYLTKGYNQLVKNYNNLINGFGKHLLDLKENFDEDNFKA